MKPASPSRAAEEQASFTVSAFFCDERQAHDAMWACLRLGVPRDLMDVAVSEDAAKQFFSGQAQPYRDGWFSWAGRGALAGLLLSAAFTLGLILFPGLNTSGWMAIVQFLGPDIGVIVGAALGGLYGHLRKTDVKPQMRRALERADAMLMLVHLQPQREAELIGRTLEAHHGESVRIDQDSAKSVGAE
ncbi:hypothetical protein [Massilia alkalitolerans]|uniref:hypothetical protein n=1 Tax=Massilia alkalitolerans TaxID=286638 RepID=UPI0003F5896E|nr:hypothetical protein [Massilia alkalitolerans]